VLSKVTVKENELPMKTYPGALMLTDGTAAKRGAANTKVGHARDSNQTKSKPVFNPKGAICLINHPV